MLTRRHLLQSAAIAPLLSKASALQAPRLAVIATTYQHLSAPQQLCDRFLIGYPRDGEWHEPGLKVVSLYVDQKSEGDLSASRGQQFGCKVYPSVAEALCAGGNRLACDAVLILADSGKHVSEGNNQAAASPGNEFFEQCVKTFHSTGAAAPVFVAFNLSDNFSKASSMVTAARKSHFPLLAGSWLPLTWRLPDIDVPFGSTVEEALVAGGGGPEQMDFHALNALQCMMERRKGGEHGVESVQLLEGDSVWEAGKAGKWSMELLSSALSRSDTPLGLTLKDGRTQDLVGSGVLPSLATNPAAFLIRYRDGARGAVLLLDGAVRDYNFACKMQGHEPISLQFLITPAPNDTYNTGLAAIIEQMFETRRAPFPVERALLTSGVLEAARSSRERQGQIVKTPELAVTYQAPRNSQYSRT